MVTPFEVKIITVNFMVKDMLPGIVTLMLLGISLT